MKALLDTSEDLDVAAGELGCEVEQLLTPLTGFLPQKPDAHFAIDNGAFAGFKRAAFEGLLRREESRRHLCRFVAVPDVVGSARRTLEVFDGWYGQLAQWPLALVAQDGLEDLPIPWDSIAAIFIGGSTEWKESGHAQAVVKAAQALGKWVHVGRVNTEDRFENFDLLNVDSIDGTGISRYSHMRERIRKARERVIQVGGRRFGYEVGLSFLGVKEYGRNGSGLSFAIPRPDAIDRKQIRALILQKMGASKECERCT